MSGDLNLINILTRPDTQFAVIKGGDSDKYTRLFYAGDCGIPTHNQDPRLVMAKVEKGGKIVGYYDPKDLETDADGNLVHPKNDLHWSLAERINQKPRELLNKKRDRGAAKVGKANCPFRSQGLKQIS